MDKKITYDTKTKQTQEKNKKLAKIEKFNKTQSFFLFFFIPFNNCLYYCNTVIINKNKNKSNIKRIV